MPASLAEVRQPIDQLDDRAPDRRAQTMERLRIRAGEEGVHPEVVRRVYTAMIDAFVELELAEHTSSRPSS